MKNPFANLLKKKNKDGAPNITLATNNKKESFFSKFIKNRLGKKAVQGEEVVGVELTSGEIRLAQMTNNKANQWVLEKFLVHKIEGLGDDATVIDNPEKIG